MAHPVGTLEPDWLERVCRITWPPDPDEAGTRRQAEQAALLIPVKDYLNSLAKPASGATIAFTLMVTQDEDPAGVGPRRGDARSHSRSSLAREAYPDLQQKARDFRRWMRMMGLVFALVLAGTCLLSWYAAFGNAALADMIAAENAVRDAELRVDGAGLAVIDAVDADHPVRVRCVPRQGDEAPTSTSSGQQGAGSGGAGTGGADADVVEVCAALNEARMVRYQAREGLDTWASFWGNETTARWTLTTLGTAVLPVLYGFIGAAAAIVRSLSRKMKASLLSPRDRQLSLQQLALGAVVGACIGLFIAGPGEKGGTDISLLGPVALSSSAISFVAGFGVEAVFNALEALIGRIFNIAPPPTSAVPPQIVPVVELPAPVSAEGEASRPSRGVGGQIDSRLP